MIAPLDLNRVSSNDLQKACSGLDPVAAQLVGLGLPQALQGTGHAERLLGKAQDAYQTGDAKQPASAGEQPTVGSQPSTAGPHANYSQHAAQTRGTYYTPLDTQGLRIPEISRFCKVSNLMRFLRSDIYLLRQSRRMHAVGVTTIIIDMVIMHTRERDWESTW